MLMDMIWADYEIADRPKPDLVIAGEQLNALIAWAHGNPWVYVPSDVSDHGWLHRFVSKRADYVWNLKELPGLNPPVREENYQPREENVFGYLGALEPRFGVDKAIRALPYILKEIPDARMEIVGSGPQREELEKLAQGLPVKFYGFLPDDEAVKVLLGWKAGVAPYGDDIPDLDSSKVRYYSWCGVPTVISSSVPRSVKLVEEFNAGWATVPTPESIASEVLNLFIDGKGPRQGCRKLAEASDCTPVFDRLFSTLSLE
jgi:glycosyltransferase involved in cell wall biosynthesis